MKKHSLFISIVVLFKAACYLPSGCSAQIIAGGAGHSFVICLDSTGQTWGLNQKGQLGNGNDTSSNFPVEVSLLTGITTAACGNVFSLALKNDSTVWSWGANDVGQLGNGNNIWSTLPVQVSSLTEMIAIAGGRGHSLALRVDSTVWAWGYNAWGELGNGSNASSNIPVQVNSLTGIIAIVAGDYHSMALKNDGTVWVWGKNDLGQLGNGNNSNSNIPIQLSSLTGVIAIAAGGDHSVALKSDSTVSSWGDNDWGQLGNGNSSNSNVPVNSYISTVVTIAAGWEFSLARTYKDTLYAWGRNSYGQFGNGTISGSNTPVKVGSVASYSDIATGYEHCLALKKDGTVWSWGHNNFGQLGNGSVINSKVPIQVMDLCQLPISCYAEFTLLADSLIPHHYWGLNQAIGYSPLTYHWSWGDGTYDSIAYPSHIYSDSGFYTICLTIQDSTGCSDSICVDYTLQKLGGENSIIKVDIVESIPSIPTTAPNTDILQSWTVFPSPAPENCYISYTLSTSAVVSISLYDALGKKMRQLVDSYQEQGEHTSTVDAVKLANGVYVLQIRVGAQTDAMKIVILK